MSNRKSVRKIPFQIWLLAAYLFWLLLTGCSQQSAIPSITPFEPGIITRATAVATAFTSTPVSKVSQAAQTIQTLRPIAQLGLGEVFASVLSPDGKYLAVSSAAGVYLYDSQTFATLWFRLLDKEFNHLAFSPDGKWLALANGQDRFEDNQPEIWEVENGNQKYILSPIRGCMSITWSPDGAEFLTMSADGGIARWQANTGKLLMQLQTSEDHCGESCLIFNAAWSRDGKQIISSSSLAIRIWDPSTANELFTLTYDELGASPGRFIVSPAPDDPRIIVSLILLANSTSRDRIFPKSIAKEKPK